MAKAVFLGLPLHGHINPSLPLVRELVARGEDVVYYSTEPFAAHIEGTGASCRRYGNAFLNDLRQLPDRIEALGWLLTRTAGEVLGEELDRIRAERPDYVIADSVAPWGQWAGEILKRPVVTSITTFAFNRHVASFAFRHGVRPKSLRLALSKMRYMAMAILERRRLRRRYAVRGPGLLGSVAGRSGLNIVYTSRYFQPCAESFDETFQFVGPSMAARPEDPDFPWGRLQHPTLVYVSMGTLFDAGASFYRACLEAFAAMDCQVVLSSGAGTVPSDPPPNAIVRPRVPQLEVLRRAAVFVTHGGMNGVSEALWFGVPLVVVPQMGEQAIVGRRVEELGAGVYLSKEAVTSATLRHAVDQVLARPGFREAAGRVRDSFLAAGGVARAADAILTFTGARGRGGSGRPSDDPLPGSRTSTPGGVRSGAA